MSSVIWMEGLGVALGVLVPARTFVRRHRSEAAR
jgi:hypothetical protein